LNRRRIIALGKSGKPTAFLTLTVSSTAYETPDDAARDLKRAWCALRRRMQRFCPGRKIPFLAVFEKHKSGFPHMHLLIRAPFIPVAKLREWWTQITEHSWNVNIMALGTRGLVAYACKYIGKDLSAFQGCKRWWRSHDFNEKTEETEEELAARRGWGRYEIEPTALLSALRQLGATVENQRGERYHWRSPPDRTVTLRDAVALAQRYWPSQTGRRIDTGQRP
jgi:hypothetical protein